MVAVAQQSIDSVVDVAVSRLAEVAKAKQAVEVQLAKQGETLASETKAKDEAMTAVAQLQAKFEALMSKLAKAEATDNTLEAKAAKIVAATASEPVTAELHGDVSMTDAEILNKFETIADKREQNKFFKANASAISRAAQANLKRRTLS
jgi:ATP adenylyltransferase/5',5'''-P-1,P-4-tetraphosphate phosphorylase II